MDQPRLSDIARQFANIFAFIFQIYASYVVGSSVGTIAQEFRSLVFPATYAFSIWGPIFILCGVYAIYQALPAQRENPIFRAIGWWTAGAFIANGAWSYAYTNRQFILAQVIILAGFLCAAGAYIRFARVASPSRATRIDTQLVGPALGLLFGWITAANVVGLASTLIAQGLNADGQGAEVGASALLLFGGAVAFFVILLSKQGPASAWIAYGAAVLWALVAVIVEQRNDSVLTSATAVVCGLLVLLAMFGPWAAPAEPLRGQASAT